MSFTTLRRNDLSLLLNSYTYIYNMRPLYLLNDEYKTNVLRIVKKSILGTNFSYFYCKHNAFMTAIVNFVIINTCFVIFPQIFFHHESIEQIIDEIFSEEQPNSKSLLFSSRKEFAFRLCVSNFIDTIIIAIIALNYKLKEKKLNKYMEKYTQYSIGPENEMIKDKLFCNLSSDGRFSIEINYSNKNNNSHKLALYNSKKNNIFFEYVINIPNIKGASNYLYKKVFNPKENEIINRINAISTEIEFKYKKKLISFLFIIIGILFCIPLLEYTSSVEKKLNYLNYFGILILSFYVQRNIFLNNKSEQIQNVYSLSKEYINDGYYIYIDSDIISIFYLKEEFRNIESFPEIEKLNQQILKNLELY